MHNISILREFINSHKFKMEIGASNNPVCDGRYTIFVDFNEDNLKMTENIIGFDKTTRYVLADAGDIPVKSSSMDCIVSLYFGWSCRSVRKLVYFFDMLSEWERIIKNTGHIVIMSTENCIGDISQMCDAVGLKIVDALNGFKIGNHDGSDYTIILQRI